MQRPDERIAPTEIQPDPQLQLSEGRASGLQITIVALACTFILGLMIYGLNQPVSEKIVASAPPAQTTGAAPAAEQPAPKGEAAPQNQPAQGQTPQQTKPAVVEDDSRR